MDPHTFNLAVAGGSVLLLVAVLAVRVSARSGLPSLLLYLALGLAVGESGLGVRFDDVQLTQTLGLLALAVILAEGGLTTRWRDVRPVLLPAAVLATVGVAVSVTTVAVGVHFLLGLDWRLAALVGAVVSSTDAAAVFSVLRVLPLRGRVAAILEVESGLNDAPAVILVSVLSSGAGAELGWTTVAQVGAKIVAGAAIGLAIGWAGTWLLRRVALPSAGLYPLATVALAMFTYAAAELGSASGFLAAYAAGVVLGNARLPHRQATLGAAESGAALAQIGLFVLLGLLASPSRLPDAIVPALVAGSLLTFVARPLSVVASLAPFRVRWREQAFVSWAGLRGAVPIVLTTIPATAGLPGSTRVFDIVFVLVVVYTLVQAPTLPLVARRLGVTQSETSREVSVDVAPLNELDADMLQLTVSPRSRLHGVYVNELRLPTGALVSLVVRRGVALIPTPETRLAAGDQLLVVTTSSARAATEDRLHAVSREGRLARWEPRAPDRR